MEQKEKNVFKRASSRPACHGRNSVPCRRRARDSGGSFFHYHRPLAGFPYLVDNQLSQNPGMAAHMDYDSVILGSSMTVNFNTDWFED